MTVIADPDVPAWLMAWTAQAAAALSLEEFTITLEVSRIVGGDDEIQAQCHQKPHINEAVLTFKVAAQDNRYWRIAVLHELIHVKHSRIDRFLEQVVFPETGLYSKGPCTNGYREVNEPFTDSMAVCLYELMTKGDSDGKDEGRTKTASR